MTQLVNACNLRPSRGITRHHTLAAAAGTAPGGSGGGGRGVGVTGNCAAAAGARRAKPSRARARSPPRHRRRLRRHRRVLRTLQPRRQGCVGIQVVIGGVLNPAAPATSAAAALAAHPPPLGRSGQHRPHCSIASGS